MRRRQFFGRVATGAALAPVAMQPFAASSARGANERVRLGLIGCGVRGMYVARFMREAPNVEFVAACDAYEPHAEAARQWAGGRCRAERDFRRVLDRDDVDAVVVATPDHWHAIPTVLACQAGKDVYVEKPLAHTIREGRAMVEAARKHDRVVQTGTQHRSAEHYREAARIVQGGELGDVHLVRIWNYMNMGPDGIGRPSGDGPPPGLDWDLYLGPAPAVPYERNRFLGSFRWFWDYAGGRITDWGTHRFDSLHQLLGVDAPATVVAAGRRLDLGDGTETPHVLQVTYEYPGFVLSYEACNVNGHGTGGRSPGMAYYRAVGAEDRPNGTAIYGTIGTLMIDRVGFEIYPEAPPGSLSASGRPPSPPRRRQVVGRDATGEHAREFIDCVRSRRRPSADVEVGHRSSVVPHLGNIAYRTGRKLRWDADSERFVGDDGAAGALLGKDARAPWDLL